MCMHGESEVGKKKAKYQCAKCGAMTQKKGHACKPEKVEPGGTKGGKDLKKKKKETKKKRSGKKKK